MRLVLVLSLLSATLCGQSVIDPARIVPRLRNFEREPNEQHLRCDVTPIRPRLNFNFRFEAGYIVRVPMNQYSGPGHAWLVLARITPRESDRKPVYLVGGVRLPNIPPNKVVWETGGFYLLGEGRYRVTWKMSDDQGRVCRKEWDIDAKPTRNERGVKLAMLPGTVADLALRGAASVSTKDDAPPLRITVLLHAAPLFPWRTRLGARDRFLLLSTLSSLMERLPARSMRLVAFNLAQQKELYRSDDFRLASIGDISQALEGVQLQTVDYQVLKNRKGHVDMIEDLVNAEITANPPSDVVVFLGPEAIYADKVPRDELETPLQGAAPRFFYLQYRPASFQQASVADTITRAVSGVKGKTVIVRSPGDFAKAIAQIEKR